jgi:ribosomal protein S18 acetylase RimI-like enzyme
MTAREDPGASAIPWTAALSWRGAAPADVPALLVLIESAYRGQESRRGWTTEADLLDGQRTGAGELERIIATPRSRILLAESGEQLMACCHVQEQGPGTAYLGMFSVRPGSQGLGIGRRLMARAEQDARAEWGAEQMQMWVIRQRAELIAWYDRLGYRATGEVRPFPYDDPGVIAKREDLEFVVLAKPL